MRVAILTNTISIAGGAERVTVEMFRTLRSFIDEVYILGREPKLDYEKLKLWCDDVKAIYKSYRFFRRVDIPWLFAEFDLIINSRSNEVLVPAHVNYYHWIPGPITPHRDVREAFMKAYSIEKIRLRHYLQHFLARVFAFGRLNLANSRYVSELLKELGIHAEVLYPPVDVEEIITYTQTRLGKKSDSVIAVSRIGRGKNLELVSEVAKRVRDAQFYIVGHLDDRVYYEELRSEAPSNVVIIPNAPRSKLYDILSEAKVLLHPAIHEQFGIAVVEGMAAGAVPVVHRSGGPWIDILEQKEGIYGYSYANPQEAAEKVQLALSAEKLIDRAKMFSTTRFRKRFAEIILPLVKA